MLDPQVVDLLHGGSALIVGTVSADGRPRAARGWGLEVGGARARLLVDADDAVGCADLVPGAAVAVTAADVRSLEAVQLKGVVSVGPAPATGDDEQRSRRYADAFFTDIVETDGTPRAVLERLVPDRLAAVELEIRELYDQTPGPAAGRELAGDEPS